jgi:hypothetical protein
MGRRKSLHRDRTDETDRQLQNSTVRPSRLPPRTPAAQLPKPWSRCIHATSPSFKLAPPITSSKSSLGLFSTFVGFRSSPGKRFYQIICLSRVWRKVRPCLALEHYERIRVAGSQLSASINLTTFFSSLLIDPADPWYCLRLYRKGHWSSPENGMPTLLLWIDPYAPNFM